jgi:hypothetical protein
LKGLPLSDEKNTCDENEEEAKKSEKTFLVKMSSGKQFK